MLYVNQECQGQQSLGKGVPMSEILTRNTLHDCSCEFCGQILQASDEVWEEAKQNASLAGKLACACAEARSFTWKHRTINKGRVMVDSVIGKNSKHPMEDEIVNLMHRSVSNIVKKKMLSITIGANGNEKVTLKITTKGIKCEREKKQNVNDEIEF